MKYGISPQTQSHALTQHSISPQTQSHAHTQQCSISPASLQLYTSGGSRGVALVAYATSFCLGCLHYHTLCSISCCVSFKQPKGYEHLGLWFIQTCTHVHGMQLPLLISGSPTVYHHLNAHQILGINVISAPATNYHTSQK